MNWDLMTALPNAMKAGQIFGTGLMIVCHTEASGEGKLDKPFTPEDGSGGRAGQPVGG